MSMNHEVFNLKQATSLELVNSEWESKCCNDKKMHKLSKIIFIGNGLGSFV